MEEDPEDLKDALNQLLRKLRQLQAGELANEIESAISRGTPEEVDSDSKEKHIGLRALTPGEAYMLALEMLVAALEPVFYWESFDSAMKTVDANVVDVDWQADFVEDSPIEPKSSESHDLPRLDGEEYYSLRQDVRKLVELLDSA